MAQNRRPRWVPTPAQGRILQRCRIESSGKRGEIEFQFEGGDRMMSPLSRHVTFTSVEGVRQSFHAIDDKNVQLVFEPADERKVVVAVAEVDFWLDDEEPEQCFLKMGEKHWEFGAAFDFRIGFRAAE